MNKNIITLHSDGFYQQKAQELFEEGMSWVSEKQYLKAKGCFEQACVFDSGVSEYQFYTGLIHYLLDELEGAESYLVRAVAAEPKEAEYGYAYAVVLYRLERPEEAVQVLEGVLAASPEHGDAQLYLAKIQAENGQHEEALRLLGILLSQDPTRFDAQFERGCVLLSLYELDQAENAFIASIHLNAQNVIAYYYLSKVYLQKGKHESAIKVLRKLQQECPEEQELAEKNIGVIEALKRI